VARLRQSVSLRAEAMASEAGGSVDWVVLQPEVAAASAATSATEVNRRRNLPSLERAREIMSIAPVAGHPAQAVSNKALTLMSG
jgi:hypothetical protein